MYNIKKKLFSIKIQAISVLPLKVCSPKTPTLPIVHKMIPKRKLIYKEVYCKSSEIDIHSLYDEQIYICLLFIDIDRFTGH